MTYDVELVTSYMSKLNRRLQQRTNQDDGGSRCPENRPFTIEMIQDKVKDISDRILSYFRNKNPTENCYE